MQNINYVGGVGSTTAQFYKDYLDKTLRAHLDIAGMAFSKYGGVFEFKRRNWFWRKTLNKLIEENYE